MVSTYDTDVTSLPPSLLSLPLSLLPFSIPLSLSPFSLSASRPSSHSPSPSPSSLQQRPSPSAKREAAYVMQAGRLISQALAYEKEEEFDEAFDLLKAGVDVLLNGVQSKRSMLCFGKGSPLPHLW